MFFKRRSLKQVKSVILIAINFWSISPRLWGINLNPDNVGDALVFPYYTVANSFNTSISLTNTTDQVKEVKVRFREGENGWEVLSFHLYLSPKDNWIGTLTSSDNGVLINTSDKSCTIPSIPLGGLLFKTSGFTQNNNGKIEAIDGGLGTPQSRLTQGYIEILEMGVINNPENNPSFTPATDATHTNGIPNNCQALTDAWNQGAWVDGVISDHTAGVSSPTGGLTGTGIIVNVAQGTSYSIKPIVIDHTFYNIGAVNHLPPQVYGPDFSSADITSQIIKDKVITTNWSGVGQSFSGYTNNPNQEAIIRGNPTQGVNAVSAILMSNTVFNQVTIDPSLAGETSWILTFPTKWYYTPLNNLSSNAGIAPFTSSFGATGAPENIGITLFDREEGKKQATLFSISTSATNVLPWAVNIFSYSQDSETNIPLSTSNLESSIVTGEEVFNGWVKAHLATDLHQQLKAKDGTIYYGLPVTGFSVQQFKSSYADTTSFFSSSYAHSFQSCISTADPAPCNQNNTSINVNQPTPPITTPAPTPDIETMIQTAVAATEQPAKLAAVQAAFTAATQLSSLTSIGIHQPIQPNFEPIVVEAVQIATAAAKQAATTAATQAALAEKAQAEINQAAMTAATHTATITAVQTVASLINSEGLH
ncbi:hypothetical protein [Candidatus Nitrosacidococcus sp. I8]|uniref:hypothetical protein n=1 Tax=Candidatus Nitrosacidococcus sp. I8 TaxID=2942908 RepID=UPI0022262040|nr:hypothetical protein [Candidatus Nitrosacidococcus sp. I8]CAH9014756.1 hypothetical protein NURINAE_00101 [Candidatus Nitrosacidococcus sp. I8]